MSPDSSLPRELLRDSEATLRIVDSLLDELRDTAPASALESDRVLELLDELTTRPAGLSALPRVLLHACAEIATVLEALRVSRALLELATFEGRRPPQLLHAAEVLGDVEGRLGAVAALFGGVATEQGRPLTH